MIATLDDAMQALGALFDTEPAPPAKPQWGDPENHRPQIADYRDMMTGFEAGRVTPREVLGRDHREVYKDSKKVAREWIYKQFMMHTALAGYDRPQVDPGDRVLTWHCASADSIRWAGVDPADPTLSRVRMTIGMRAGGTTDEHVFCPVEDVAPADTPLPHEKDMRLDICNDQPRPGPWVTGKWRLHVPVGDGRTHEKWFTKRADAVRYGRVWLAVLDYHNAVSRRVTCPWQPPEHATR